MQTLSRRLAGSRTLLGALIGIAALSAAHCARADVTDGHGDTVDVVTKLSDTSQQTVWRITQPNINKATSNYPQIQFMPGDKFRVLAGGCDQTGGHGKTWKLYVNPQGDNTDHLYHGTISVDESLPHTKIDPGMANYSRLADWGVGDGLGKGDPAEHYIPNPLPAGHNGPITLNLGFEDDGYGDNGYWGRDPGNNDQCVNVPAAFLIITIGHHGAIPADPGLYWGIRPADFDCQGGWAFHNGDTKTLSYASFKAAFNITWAGEYLNPLNEILFQAGKGMASTGNCEGMCLLSLAGEDQFVVGDLRESFWANYKAPTFAQAPANLQFDINVAHWQQLSGYFVHNWLVSIESDASTVVAKIEHDLNAPDYNYGMLSLKHGGGGHVLVPLAVTKSGEHTYISVYNPNIPCPSIPNTQNNPKIDVVGQNWSYDMGGSDGVWSGSNGVLGLANNGMAYIPYHGPDDGWTDQVSSLSGAATAIFGGDASVDQVTDGRGRKLFVNGKMDQSENGLGRFVVKLPHYDADAAPKRPRSGDKAKVMRVEREGAGTPEQQALLAKLERDYADYEATDQVFVIRDATLTDLTFTLSAKTAGKPLRAAIGKGNTFLETRSEAASGTDRPHGNFVVHSLTDLAGGGVTMAPPAGSTGLKVVFTHGVYDERAKAETLQQTSQVTTMAGARVKIANNEMVLLTGEAPATATISRQLIPVDGKNVTTTSRTLTTEKLQ